MNLLLGMRRGDGVDLLDDDLLEGSRTSGLACSCWGGNQAAVIEATQQVTTACRRKLTPNSSSRMRRKSWQRQACRRHLGGWARPRGGHEPRHIRRGQAGRASGAGPLLEAARPPWSQRSTQA